MRARLQLTKPSVPRLCWPIGNNLSSAGDGMVRLGDFLIASVLLAFTSPLFLFVALAIRCESPGSVFKRHERIGPDARRFQLLTFRTTVHDPNDRIPDWARRPTRLGAFLRYTRMVALPQLVNALRGDISLFEADGWPSLFRD